MKETPHRGVEVARPGTAPADPFVWVELLTQMPRPVSDVGAPHPVQARLLAQVPLPPGTPKTPDWFRVYEDQIAPYGESDEEGVITITDRAGYHWGLPGERILVRRYARCKYEPVTSGAPIHAVTTVAKIYAGRVGEAYISIRRRESRIQIYCPSDVVELPYEPASAVRSGIPVNIQATVIPSSFMPQGAVLLGTGSYLRWEIQPVPPSKLE